MGVKQYKIYYLVLYITLALTAIMLYLTVINGFDGLKVNWPPGYYMLRDRVPFFMSIIYLYRNMIPADHRTIAGYYMLSQTALLAICAAALYLMDRDMTALAGIHWSPPSPIEWGTLIVASAIMLHSRGIEIFESYYMGLLTAMGGGWLYEAHGWILDWNLAALLKINSAKVFFIDFQLLCLPILLYIVATTKRYRRPILLIPLIISAVAFYALTPWLKVFLPPYIGLYGYRWIIRVPTILVLFNYLYGVKGEKI